MLKHLKTIGALDIGSSHITFIVAEISDNKNFKILHSSQISSIGISKGNISDNKKISNVLEMLFNDLSKNITKFPQDVCLSQSGNHLHTINYDTTLSFEDFNHIINDDDLFKLNKMALNKELPNETVALHHCRQFYSINNAKIDNPIGVSTNQISVNYNIFFGQKRQIQDKLCIVNQLGFVVKNLVFSGIASALSTTTEIERNNGICVIDIGDQITDFVVYKNQIPISMGTLPVGGTNFTYDLCSGLHDNKENCEKFKHNYGIPINLNLDRNENLQPTDISNTTYTDQSKIQNANLILEERAKEIFQYILKYINVKNVNTTLLSGVVLTGGGSLLKKIECIAAKTLQCDCYVRLPFTNYNYSKHNETILNPSYATCIGLINYVNSATDIYLQKKQPSSFKQRIATLFS